MVVNSPASTSSSAPVARHPMAQAWRECMLLGIAPNPAAWPFAYGDQLMRSWLDGALEAEFRICSLGISRLPMLLRRARQGNVLAQRMLVEAIAAAHTAAVRSGSLCAS